jgi:hypothetical protein
MTIKEQAIVNILDFPCRIVFYKGKAFGFLGDDPVENEEKFLADYESYVGEDEENWIFRHYGVKTR